MKTAEQKETETYKYIVYQDGKEKKVFENQTSDICIFIYMHRVQGQSIHWATKYGGWKIECFNEQTGEQVEY
jgi:hypothetical protein